MLGEKLKKIRKSKGFTQEQLSKKVGISTSYIQQIERGVKQNPSLEVIFKLTKELNVEASELLGSDYNEIAKTLSEADSNNNNDDLKNLLDEFFIKLNYILTDLYKEIIEQDNTLFNNYTSLFCSLPYEFNDIIGVLDTNDMISKLIDDNTSDLVISLIRKRIKKLALENKESNTKS